MEEVSMKPAKEDLIYMIEVHGADKVYPGKGLSDADAIAAIRAVPDVDWYPANHPHWSEFPELEAPALEMIAAIVAANSEVSAYYSPGSDGVVLAPADPKPDESLIIVNRYMSELTADIHDRNNLARPFRGALQPGEVAVRYTTVGRFADYAYTPDTRGVRPLDSGEANYD